MESSVSISWVDSTIMVGADSKAALLSWAHGQSGKIDRLSLTAPKGRLVGGVGVLV